MGDQLRNNMFDKYYKKIGCQDRWAQSGNGYDGAHYLMSWYTSWGGALDGSWTWQIGASHCHEFYQNPLAAFALLQDNGLKNAMKGQDAVKDYTTSLQRQMEFYLWLQSANGPIAGGATSSWNGRYEAYKYNETDAKKYGTDVPTTFYDMGYQEHPVYLDPGSNHWIGNQVWAVQRLAEMYYVIKENGDKMCIRDSLSAALTFAAVVPATASAAGTRTKEEKYGDDSYAKRFLSLYDDVITNGVENGLSLIHIYIYSVLSEISIVYQTCCQRRRAESVDFSVRKAVYMLIKRVPELCTETIRTFGCKILAS